MGGNQNITPGSNMPSNALSKDGHTINTHAITLVIYCVAFVLGTIGNGLVIYVTSFRMKKTVNTIWFLNLAVADFLFTTFLIFSIIHVSRGFGWPFGDFMCKLHSLVTVINMFTSIFLLTAISLDRCLSTWVVVWAQNKRTPRKAEIACVVIWLAALGCSLPYTIMRDTKFSGNITICAYTFPKGIETYRQIIIFRFVIGFFIPFLIIAGSYVAIGIRIKSLHRQKNSKSMRVIILVILTFFLCWLPFHVIQFLDLKSRLDSLNPTFQKAISIALPLSTSLAFLNSCLNPFLYVFMCDDFRLKLRQSVLLVLEGAFIEDSFHSRTSSSRTLQPLRREKRNDTNMSLV